MQDESNEVDVLKDEGLSEVTIQMTSAVVSGLASIASMAMAGTFFAALSPAVVLGFAFWGIHAQASGAKRTEKLISEIQAEMDSLDDTKVDKEWFGSGEHQDLIAKGFVAAAKAKTDDQIKMYAKILVGASIPELREGHDLEAYLDLLQSLTAQQVQVAAIVWELQKSLPVELLDVPISYMTMPWSKSNLSNTLPDELINGLDLSLHQLERSGLIVLYNKTFVDRSNYPAGVPAVTRIFRQLMNYVEHDFEANEALKEDISLSLDMRVLVHLVDISSGPVPARVFSKGLMGLSEEFPDSSPQQLIDVLNRLSHEGMIEFDKVSSKGLLSVPENIRVVTVKASGLQKYLHVGMEDWRLKVKELADLIYDGVNFEQVCEKMGLSSAAVYFMAEKLCEVGYIHLPRVMGTVRWSLFNKNGERISMDVVDRM